MEIPLVEHCPACGGLGSLFADDDTAYDQPSLLAMGTDLSLVVAARAASSPGRRGAGGAPGLEANQAMTEPVLVATYKRCKECGGLMRKCDIEPSVALPVRYAWVCENDPRHCQTTYSKQDEQ